MFLIIEEVKCLRQRECPIKNARNGEDMLKVLADDVECELLSAKETERMCYAKLKVDILSSLLKSKEEKLRTIH